MPFQILPATPQDADEIAKFRLNSSISPRMMLEMRDVKPEDYYAWHRAHVIAKLRISDPEGDIVSLKMVDEETGLIAAFYRWGLSSQANEKDARARHGISPALGTNLGLNQRMAQEMTAMAQRNPQVGDHYILLDLFMAPVYRRRGLASLLVEWGMERADAMGETIVLDASPSGFPLYRSLGFGEVDRLEIPLEQYGGGGVHVHGNVVDMFGYVDIFI